MLFVLAGLLGLAVASTGRAHVEADPNKEYAVTPEVGPWMIYTAHFTGPRAAELAHEMVLEIRSRFDLPAWVYNRGSEERKAQEEQIKQLREKYGDQHVPLRMTRVQEQCAVLIGGYKDADAATRALKAVKKLDRPSRDELMPRLTIMEPLDKNAPFAPPKQNDSFINPFPNSFVARNPTVPQERQAKGKNDSLLKDLNSGEKYSLLRCRKPYTLAVASYQGLSVFTSAEENKPLLDRLWGKYSGDMLQASGQNAHEFAAALRKLNFEAYVLHTRGGSLVTIGGYDRPDDPTIQTVQRTLAAHLQFSQGVQMLPQPLVIEVPRP
jgi:hypothetical protein